MISYSAKESQKEKESFGILNDKKCLNIQNTKK